MATRLTSADTFRAVAARTKIEPRDHYAPALRNAYRQVAMGYARLAEQQEAVERGHALIGRLHADDIAMDAHPSGRPGKGRDDNSPLKDEIAINQSMKAMLQHAPEMEAIGLLTARIAHDFNNLLIAVGGSAVLISTDLSSDSVICSHIATIMRTKREPR
jgi:hypothetical protein